MTPSSTPFYSYSFTAVAPGRLCLFGEHQDYLGFPVVAVAIPLYCSIHVTVNYYKITQCHPSKNDDTNDCTNPSQLSHNTVVIQLHVPTELGESKVYDVNSLPPSPPVTPPSDDDGDSSFSSPDFALAAIHEVLREGWQLFHPPRTTHDDHHDGNNNCSGSNGRNCYYKMDVQCTSTNGELPIQAGCSSSTAFLMSWILVLGRLAGKERLCPLKLAQLTHRSEVTHFGHPGGTMDHVSIALGGPNVLRIGPDPWHVERLPILDTSSSCADDKNDAAGNCDNGVWILVDSGEPKDTLKHLKRCKQDRLDLLHGKLHGDWDYAFDNEEEERPALLSEMERRLWMATIINRDTEAAAATLWRKYHAKVTDSSSSSSSSSAVGWSLANLMKQHHASLRDGLCLSTPRLEAINEAALDAGAWAFKIVGSGGGGCGVAWAPTSKAPVVAKAMMDAGAKKTWTIGTDQPGHGAHIVI